MCIPANRLLSTLHTAVLLAMAAIPGAAQELRVRIAEPGTGNPAVGVLVTLLDQAGRPAAAGVANDFGRVRLRAPAGTYQARVERPGFLDTTVSVVVPPGLDSTAVTHAARRPAFPDRLIAPPESCVPGTPAGPIRTLLDEAARTARVVATTEDQGATTLNIATFERQLSTSLRRDSEQVNTILGARNRPTNALPAVSLARAGYLTREDEFIWAAPSAAVFAADEFVASHCYGLVNGEDNRLGMLGLRFVPAPAERVQIEGMMWFDPTTRQLRVIDYRFNGVPDDWRPDRFGGTLEFHRAEPGFWITRFWYQRVPRLETSGGRDRLRGYREDGAEVLSVLAAVDTTDRIAAARAIARQSLASQLRVASLAGTVVDTLGYPVPEAEVVVMGTEFKATSDNEGNFALGGLPLGLQIIQVRKLGYKPQYFGLRLAGGQEWEGKVAIARLPQTLGEVVVVGRYGKPAVYANTAKYDGFYRRRASAGGRFLTREQIDQQAAARISDLLKAVPGVRVSFTAPGQGEDISFLSCPAYNVGVWIDGQKVSGNVGEILPLISPSDVEAMEIYQRQSAVPPEFRDNSCAAIVMWTR